MLENNKKLIELIDFERVNILLEGFNKTTGFVTAILDLEGNVLSKSGWRQICTEFHRAHPATSKKCTISDTELAGKLAKGEKYHFYKCLNGLVDVAVPIIVKGEHIANLFSGQFFFEKPNREFFVKQAKKYNFDNATYLDALDKVPIVSEEKVNTTMDFLLNMTQLISEMSSQKMEQVELNKALKSSEENFRTIIEQAGDAMYLCDFNGNIKMINKHSCEMLGYKQEELVKMKVGELDANYIDLKLQKELWNKLEKDKPQTLLSKHKRKDGKHIPVEIRFSLTNYNKEKAILGFVRDITERKEAEAELLQSKILLQASIESPKDMVILSLDHDYRYMYFNSVHTKTMEQIYGATPQLGTCIFDLINSNEEIEQLKTHYKRALKGESHVSIEEYGNTARIYYETQFNPIYNNKKEIIGVTAFAQDISARKQADEALQKSNSLLKSVLDSPTNIIMLASDADFNYLSFNQAHADAVKYTYGTEPEIGKNILSIMTVEEDRLIAKANYKRVLKGERFVEIQEFGTEETRSTWQLIFNPIINFSDQVTGFTVFVHDISEQKNAEKKLKETLAREQLLADIVRESSVGIAIGYADGRLGMCNSAYQRITGYSEEELKNIDWNKVLTPPEWEEVEAAKLREVNLTKKPVSYEKEYIRKDGSIVPIELLVNPRFDANGEVEYYFAFVIDISERKKAEEEIKVSEFRFRQLVNTINSGVAIYKVINDGKLGSDYIVEEFNEFALSQDGKKKEDIIGKSLFDIRPNIDEFGIIDVFRKVWKTGQPEFYPAKVYRDDNFSNYYENRVFKLPSGEIVAVYDDVTEKERAEEKLKESEFRLNKVLNTSPFPIAVVDVDDDVILYWSESAITMFGHNPSTAGEWYELAYPDPAYRQEVIERWKPLLKVAEQSKTAVNTGEYNIVCKDGSIKICEIYAQFIPGNLIVTMHDVTESNKAEIALQESKVFNETLLNTSPDIIYIYNIVDNKNVYSNDGIMKILGYSREEIQNMGDQLITQLMHPDDFKIYLNDIFPRYQQLKDNELVSHEYRMKHKKGKWHWLLSKESIFLRDTAGNPIQIFGMISDNTERKQAEITLANRNKYIESIMDNMPIGFAVNSIDDGDVKYMNNLFEEIYGWPKNILTNTSIFFDKVYPDPEYRKKMKSQIIADMQSGDPERMKWNDLKIVTSSGEERFVYAFNIPLVDQNLMISTVQDTTKRKLAEDEIVRHKEHLEELVEERTVELKKKYLELERMNKLFVDRELRMVELKEEIKKLEK